ncbi:MAG: hypothetical protein IT342_04370 [Candidatus Melainabacteria bacterium]|nr:hypothetical protein [Candidatus Melainabacteria bacterium]
MNLAQVISYGTFYLTFASNTRRSGVITSLRGRIAFPSSRGPQPKAGETWHVTIAGENPKRTVYFLSCIEKVENGA